MNGHPVTYAGGVGSVEDIQTPETWQQEEKWM